MAVSPKSRVCGFCEEKYTTVVYLSVVTMVKLQLDEQRTGPGMNGRYHLFRSKITKRNEEEQEYEEVRGGWRSNS